MAWYLAPSLFVLRSEVNTRWPRRDRTSDGTIGDEAHQQTQSDHNPNDRESVDAWDMDKDGVDVAAVIAAFERHPSAHYWIWNREIADRDSGWQRRAYTGENPHTQHAHFSIRQSAAAEQDRRSWGLLEGATMEVTSLSGAALSAIATANWSAKFGTTETAGGRLAELVVGMRALLAAQAGDQDAEQIVAELRAQGDLVRAEMQALAAAEAARDEAAGQRDAEMLRVLERHDSGELSAEAVVQRIGDLLSGAAQA